MRSLQILKLSAWPIRAKLIALAGTLLLFTAATAGIALYKMNQMALELDHIADRDLPATAALQRVAMLQLERAIALESSLRAAEVMSDEMSAGVQFVKASTAFTELGEQVADDLVSAREIFRDAASTARSEAVRQEFLGILDRISEVELTYITYSVNAAEALEATASGRRGEAIALTQEVKADQDHIEHELGAALAQIEGFTRSAVLKARAEETAALWLLLVVAFAAVSVGTALSVVLTRAITKPLNKAVEAVEALAEGDTTVTLTCEARNEMGVLAGAVQVLRKKLDERDRMGQQLMQAQKMDAVGQLTGGIAHDFNNLLMIVDGYTRRALGRAGADQQLETSLQEVLKATDVAAKLTKQLLVFSRRQVMEKKVFRVAEALQDVEPLFRKSVSEGVQLDIECEDEALSIHTDQTEFTQAVLNLVNNARDALPGVGTITIRSEQVNLDEAFVRDHEGLEPGPYVTISVADTGCGISDSVKAHLFEPFFTTKGQGKGTGLGLPMVLGFSQQSGGTLIVESTVGEGTTIHILLPLATGAALKAAAEIDEACNGKGERLLIVEDEEALRVLNSETLRELGYEILTACDGFEALEVEGEFEGEIDLLLSDVVMPQMGGFELCQIMREKRPDLKAIFVSGYPNRAEAEGTPMPENCRFLQKPVKPGHLAQAIRRELDAAPA